MHDSFCPFRGLRPSLGEGWVSGQRAPGGEQARAGQGPGTASSGSFAHLPSAQLRGDVGALEATTRSREQPGVQPPVPMSVLRPSLWPGGRRVARSSLRKVLWPGVKSTACGQMQCLSPRCALGQSQASCEGHSICVRCAGSRWPSCLLLASAGRCAWWKPRAQEGLGLSASSADLGLGSRAGGSSPCAGCSVGPQVTAWRMPARAGTGPLGPSAWILASLCTFQWTPSSPSLVPIW